MTTSILAAARQGGYADCRIPGVVVTDAGTILTYWEARLGDDWSVTDLLLRRSTDGGKTFLPPQTLYAGGGQNTVHNCVLFANGSSIVAVFCRNYCQVFCSVSTDEGTAFSAPVEITYAFDALFPAYPWQVCAVGPGHGIVTRGGRLLAGCWLSANHETRHSHRPSVLTTLASDDGGASWYCGDIIWGSAETKNSSENVLAELADGRIMMNIRHEGTSRRRAVAFSPDGLHTWSKPALCSALPDPICAAGLTQRGQTLYFSNCASEGSPYGRIDLTLRASEDEGVTWSRARKIASRSGYSDVFASPSGELFVFYEYGRIPGTNAHAYLALSRVSPEKLV